MNTTPNYNMFIKYGYLIQFNKYAKKVSGTVKKLGKKEIIKFTISDKKILSDPPASQLPIKIRHLIEKLAPRSIKNK